MGHVAAGEPAGRRNQHNGQRGSHGVERARWVAAEVWHPDQRSNFDGQGRYLLELPFSDDRERVLDILRHGAEVEMVSPMALRRKVCAEHAAAAESKGGD